MIKTLVLRIGSVLLCTVLCLSSYILPAAAWNSKDEIQDKIDEQESRKADSEQNASKFQQEINDMQAEIDVVNQKISDLNVQIADKNKVIAQYQEEVNGLQKEINAADVRQQELDTEISATYDLLSERLYATYVAGETSTLELLLSAEDFETFLTRLELVRRIAEHDTSLVSDLQADIDELKATTEKLSRDKAAVEEKQAAVKSERDAIAASRAEEQQARNLQESKQNSMEQKLSQASKSAADAEKQIEKLNAAMEEYDRQQAAGMENGSGSINNSGSSNYPVSSKGMIRPLQYPNVVISAGWYGYPGHKGIDFTTAGATGNTYGKEIRAAADGVVYSSEYHYSWGNNVYINHGNGVYTRYAHCSKLLVGKGQTVKQGQVIAYVGNTGNVSPRPSAANPHAGAHLHFEVWVNGDSVNPAPWLP
ncbi:MAG: peptidoglycan DD-metalloendopeptidase family protein [Lachnospiraceae bacterium]